MVAKIGLSVAAAASLGLLLVLGLVSDDQASSYGQIIGAFDQARQYLGPALLVFGLALAGFAGVSAWLFSLYASFRIAGPLYRMARDLELQIDQGPITPTPIRATDRLQREWKVFEAGVWSLRAQHAELKQALVAVGSALETHNKTVDAATLASALARLKDTEQRVRL